MSIRGPQALASLEEAMGDIRREEDELSKRLARSAERDRGTVGAGARR